MNWPPIRWVYIAVFAVTCFGLAATPLVHEFTLRNPLPLPLFPTDHPPTAREMFNIGPDGNKDYTLWYQYGRVVAESHHFEGGLPLYIQDPKIGFPFLYPPFAAVCLAPLTVFGPQVMTVLLVLPNVGSFAAVVELSIRAVDPTGRVSPWVRLLPSALCIFFVYDVFLLGQPNLGLLALVLGGLALARGGRGWWAGIPLAAAAAIKAFPVVVLLYLLWRRQWAAAASMTIWLGVFLFVLPVPIRGWDRNLSDLNEWANGMLFSRSDDGPGQRPERSLGWRNQSLIGTTSRLLRAGNAKAEETNNETDLLDFEVNTGRMTAEEAEAVRNSPTWPGRPMYVNLIDFGPKGGSVAALVVAGLLGVGFLLVMPFRTAARTRRTDALELGMLVTLITVASP